MTKYRKVQKHIDKDTWYLAIFLTMLPTFVTALPIPSLTRDIVTRHNTDDFKVMKYLVRYGHLNKKPDTRKLSQKLYLTAVKTTETPYTADEISTGIKNLQNSLGLQVTGKLNEDTLKIIQSPRCAMSDKGLTKPFQVNVHHRNRRYAVYHRSKDGTYKIFKWTKQVITWQIRKPWTGGMSTSKQEEIFEKAFKIWEYASPLRFHKQAPKSGSWPDIDVEFLIGNHNDAQPFDGPGGALGHAFLPGTYKDGDIHLDADEKWSETFLYNVAVHEIGHSLGLGHSWYYDSVMYPAYTQTAPITSLHQDDKDGVSKIYGECLTKIDAVIHLANNDLIFIRKDLVWKYDSVADRVHIGYPKNINDEFPAISGPKIPSDLDCASRFANQQNKIDFFFVKGDQVYIYDPRGKKTTVKTSTAFWPNSHGIVPGIPKKVTVAVSITTFPIGTWIFKDDYVWRYNDYPKREIRSGYPEKISTSEWNGLPQDIDDGFYDDRDYKFYFFKDTNYYEISVVPADRPKTKPYVRPRGFIHKKWKGICSDKY